jgi:hypothetical protein
VLENNVTKMEMVGCTSKIYPGNWEVGYTSNNKKSCVYSIYSKYKKWLVDFNFSYYTSTKEFQGVVKVRNLNLSGNSDSAKKLHAAIDKRFPSVTFKYFAWATEIALGVVKCKKAEDVKKALDSFCKTWNSCDFLPFADVNFQTSEELKGKK